MNAFSEIAPMVHQIMQKQEQQCFVLWLDHSSYAATKLGSLNNYSGLNGICVVMVLCTRTVCAMLSLIKGCHSSNIFSSQQQQYCFTVAVVFWHTEVNNQEESPYSHVYLYFRWKFWTAKARRSYAL